MSRSNLDLRSVSPGGDNEATFVLPTPAQSDLDVIEQEHEPYGL